MTKNIDNLEDFICARSFQHKLYLEDPIMFSCGHAACNQCVDNLKSNTGLKQIKCLKCNKENSLEVDYDEADLIKRFMRIHSRDITKSLEKEFDEIVRKSKSIKNYKIRLNIAFKRFLMILN
jgi:hypothetical protein